MKYLITTLILGFLSMPVLAFSAVSTEGLTDKQKAELALQAATMKENASAISISKPKVVKEWVEVGAAIGNGLAATAEQLGIASDKILDTNAGTLAAIMIIWTYMGSSIVGVLFSFMWLMFGVSTWVWLYKKRFIIDKVIIYEKGADDANGKRKQIIYRSGNLDETGTHFFYWFTLMLIILAGFIGIISSL